MKKLVFRVEVEFEDKINQDNEINEVTDSILRALVSEVNNGIGLVPEDSETFTKGLVISNQVTGYEVKNILFLTDEEKKREKQIIRLGNFVSEYQDEDDNIITVEMQLDELIKAFKKEKKEGIIKSNSERADYVPLVQMIEAYEFYSSIYGLLDEIGYPVWK